MLHKTIAVTSVAVVLACTAVLHGDERAAAERFTFTVANAPADALKNALTPDGRFHLTINRWSTDEERALVAAAAAEPAKLLEGFRNTPNVGYLQWPGGTEYGVRYARRVPRPDGGADIVLVADRPLWVWWDANSKWSDERPFSLVHIRVDKDGRGEGRASTSIKADEDAGVALTDLSQPALITELRRAS